MMKPIIIDGTIVPSTEPAEGGWRRNFKLACASGAQYSIEAGTEWQKVLTRHSWQQVKVIGLLIRTRMAIVLQKLFPFGPPGSGLSIANFAPLGLRRAAKEIFGGPDRLVAAGGAAA